MALFRLTKELAMFSKKFKIYKLEERIVLDAAVTGDATEAPSSEPADTNGPLEGVWPVFGQDYTNDGFNESENVLDKKNIGSLQLDVLSALPGFDSGVSAQPSLSNDGILYVGTAGGEVYAINADTGEHIWVTQTGIGDIVTTPAITEDMVLVSSEHITALDRATGAILWSTDINIGGEYITVEASYYTQFVNANGDHLTQEALLALQPLGWTFDANGNASMPALNYTADITVITDPVTGRDLAIVGLASEQNYIASVKAGGYFHPDTGTSSIVPLEDFIAVGQFAAFDLSDGSLVWNTPTLDADSGAAGSGSWASQAYDAQRNVIFMAGAQMHRLPNSAPGFDYSDSLVALNASTGEVIDSVQFTSGDVWGPDFFPTPPEGIGRDWDVNLHPQLFTEKIRGEEIDFVGVGDKSGEYHILIINDDGSMSHLLSLKLDPGQSMGALQSTPSLHDGVLTISSYAALQYTDPNTGESYLVDPGIADPSGQYGFRLVDIGVGLLLPEIYFNPNATPIDLSLTERVSGDLFGDVTTTGFNNLLFNASGKMTSIDIQALLRDPMIFNAMKGGYVVELTPTEDSKFVNFVEFTPGGMAFGPTGVVGPTDNNPHNDIIIQTYANGQVKMIDGKGNLLRHDIITAPNTDFMTIGGGVTIDNDGDLFIGYGLFGGGGVVKYSLPDNVTSTAEGGEGLIAATTNTNEDEEEEVAI